MPRRARTGTQVAASVKATQFAVAKAPVSPATAVAAPTDLASCIVAINAIRAALTAMGITL